MRRRWIRNVIAKLPSVDQFALGRGRKSLQHAPEYSQACYDVMRGRERSLGNYFASPACRFGYIGAPKGPRRTMVFLIEELHALKNYRELTLYLAVNIADMHLAGLASRG